MTIKDESFMQATGTRRRFKHDGMNARHRLVYGLLDLLVSLKTLRAPQGRHRETIVNSSMSSASRFLSVYLLIALRCGRNSLPTTHHFGGAR